MCSQPQQQFVNNAFNQRRRNQKESVGDAHGADRCSGRPELDSTKPGSVVDSPDPVRRATQTFWVAFVDGTGALKKARSVKFAQNATLKFGDANSPREFNVSQVLDYTCALDCK
jgi:hypothetical protein